MVTDVLHSNPFHVWSFKEIMMLPIHEVLFDFEDDRPEHLCDEGQQIRLPKCQRRSDLGLLSNAFYDCQVKSKYGEKALSVDH